MGLFLQILVISLAVMGLYIMAVEIARIYGREKIKGRIYILCVPQTDNIEGFCSELIYRYRRNGFAEDILICSSELTEEEKNIGRVFESADKGIYLIEPDDLPRIVRKD